MRKVVCTEFQPENPKERNHLENKRAGGKTMFKAILKKLGKKTCTGFA